MADTSAAVTDSLTNGAGVLFRAEVVASRLLNNGIFQQIIVGHNFVWSIFAWCDSVFDQFGGWDDQLLPGVGLFTGEHTRPSHSQRRC
jgi:hypothetical protein